MNTDRKINAIVGYEWHLSFSFFFISLQLFLHLLCIGLYSFDGSHVIDYPFEKSHIIDLFVIFLISFSGQLPCGAWGNSVDAETFQH